LIIYILEWTHTHTHTHNTHTNTQSRCHGVRVCILYIIYIR
jgi:hypothetical protein